MAELDSAARDRILGVFLPEYNRLHGTNYHFDSAEPEDDMSCDFLCIDPARPREPLKVQHTVAAREDDRERRAPIARDRIVREVLRHVRRNNGRGILVGLDVDKPPLGRDDQEKLAYRIWMAIREALRENSEDLLLFDRQSFEAYIGPISPTVSRLRVSRIGPSDVPAQVHWMSIEGGLIPLTAGERVRAAVDRKALAGRASGADSVLLVHFDLWPYDEELDLPDMIRELETHNPGYREIWVVDDAEVPAPTSHRVWPGESTA